MGNIGLMCRKSNKEDPDLADVDTPLMPVVESQKFKMTSKSLMLIDVQKCFSEGTWADRFGLDEVQQIREAYDRCVDVLRVTQHIPTLVTRTPFPGPDGELDDRIKSITQERGIECLSKPGNSVLHAVGFVKWMEERIRNGSRIIVMGGNTTTSCVKTSSVAIARAFRAKGLQVVVDLSMCGARATNHKKRCPDCLESYEMDYEGPLCDACVDPSVGLQSPVEAAVKEMKKNGVTVVEKFKMW
ncbi:uncharacterized protein LOC144920976 isoform X1 [Branchiostoma floridae x Branchiostoma belcheri]